MIRELIPLSKPSLSVEVPLIPTDSILNIICLSNRDEVILNEKKTSLAELRYDIIKRAE